MDKIKLEAPCKINLFLEVVGKRDDGYHDIESVMSTVPLCDTVKLTKCECGVFSEMDVSECALPGDVGSLSPEDDLSRRAASLFLKMSEERNGEKFGLKITTKKRIPVCAGLGGGSADAAAVLKGANILAGSPFSEDELCRIASPLGADIPFCIKGGAALCRGIGDIMDPIPCNVKLQGVISCEKAMKRSTGEAYSMIDRSVKRARHGSEELVKALESGDFEAVCAEMYNDFGELCAYPCETREILRAAGAKGVLMSGAGPSVFGLFDDENTASKAVEILKERGRFAYVF